MEVETELWLIVLVFYCRDYKLSSLKQHTYLSFRWSGVHPQDGLLGTLLRVSQAAVSAAGFCSSEPGILLQMHSGC